MWRNPPARLSVVGIAVLSSFHAGKPLEDEAGSLGGSRCPESNADEIAGGGELIRHGGVAGITSPHAADEAIEHHPVRMRSSESPSSLPKMWPGRVAFGGGGGGEGEGGGGGK